MSNVLVERYLYPSRWILFVCLVEATMVVFARRRGSTCARTRNVRNLEKSCHHVPTMYATLGTFLSLGGPHTNVLLVAAIWPFLGARLETDVSISRGVKDGPCKRMHMAAAKCIGDYWNNPAEMWVQDLLESAPFGCFSFLCSCRTEGRKMRTHSRRTRTQKMKVRWT